MVKRMLIDASHAEETRVVVASGTRLEEFDFESAARRQLKGNIYLAKVMRVEPSLQAAFVDYGGNRHGFLPFSEIHPDYYQIPVADREALYAAQEAALEEVEEPPKPRRRGRGRRGRQAADRVKTVTDDVTHDAPEEGAAPEQSATPDAPEEDAVSAEAAPDDTTSDDTAPDDTAPDLAAERAEEAAPEAAPEAADDDIAAAEAADAPRAEDADEGAEDDGLDAASEAADDDAAEDDAADDDVSESAAAEDAESVEASEEAGADDAVSADVEDLGGDDLDEMERRRLLASRSLLSRRYRIQEVVKKRQIMLVQVVKEERGTKGAALTTYLSLAGRYIVLMPNALRGGGISRKIVNAEDRRRLKRILGDLNIPPRMGVIVRTAGVSRSKAEIKRDFEYLLRQWETIREQTLQSTAPCLINEEANLIRRSIRDLYVRDIDEILIEGEEGYKVGKSFMRTLIPSHTSKVQPYRDRIPLFTRYQVESQLDSMYSPDVQLRSGGYLVINPTEALVSIDVNSGRSTKERNIEETALKTNLEAAEEIARQLRLRDLAGLIVIDFIDMDENRNQRAVERRLKEAMRSDRARIQIGRISAFGLLELSRQRLRPSFLEASMERCGGCHGTGVVRSVGSSAVHVLRAIEEEGLRDRSAEILVRVPAAVAIYVLSHKRQTLAEIEERYAFTVRFAQDDSLVQPAHAIDRVRSRDEEAEAEAQAEAKADAQAEAQPEAAPETAEEETDGRRGKRRRRRKPRGGAQAEEARAAQGAGETEAAEEARAEGADEAAPEAGEGAEEEGATKRRRRGRRGGRRRTSRSRERSAAGEDATTSTEEAPAEASAEGAETPEAEPAAADQTETAAPEAETAAPETAPAGAEPEAERPADAAAAPAEPADGEPGDGEEPSDGARRIEIRTGPPAEIALSDSTEPARGNGGSPDESLPEPSTVAEPDDPDKPRRRGWWQRLNPTR